MKSVVAKFGGSSVANIKQLLKVIKTSPHQKVIVVSAPGKLNPNDKKVTDLLISYTEKKDQKIQKLILSKFKNIGASNEILVEIEAKLISTKSKNQIYSLGEYYSAKIIAQQTGLKFIDAAEIFRFKNNGKLDFTQTSNLVKNILSNPRSKYIVPGFYGADSSGKIQLFGRGGSDRTGALLASILGYDYENWTDVNGIYSADPRIVKDAYVTIPEITIEEVREGANGGAEILMGDTIFDLHQSNVTTTIKNTFKPKEAGTRVLQSRTSDINQHVIGVAGHDDIEKLEIRRFGLNKIPGYVHRLLAHFSSESMPISERISFEYLPMGIDALSIAIRTSQLSQPQLERLDKIMIDIANDPELAPDNKLKWTQSAVVYLVGQDLLNKKTRTYVHHRATGSLIKSNLYFEDDVSDAGSPSIAFLIDRKTMNPAIETLHQEFFVTRN